MIVLSFKSLTYAITMQLTKKAQAWADHLAATNKFEHDPVGCGENIAQGIVDPKDATQMWYCEVDDYKKNPNKWTPIPMIGHFTQVSA